MKSMLSGILILAVAAFAALALWVRFAPSDPARWHVAVTGDTPPQPGPCTVTDVPHGARATCLIQGDPGTILTRLNDTALVTPRTTLLAGSPTEGRMTWITRSALMGYPDYITAEAVQTPQGTRLDILSRQRFGEKDFGVNAARLTTWLQTL